MATSISTDGLIPDYISRDTLDNVMTLNKKALSELNKITGEIQSKNNNLLKFLAAVQTCPDEIPKLLLNLLTDDLTKFFPTHLY